MIPKLAIAPSLLLPTAALSLSSAVSTGRNAATAGVVMTQQAVAMANIPAALAVAAEKTKEFATESVPQATVQAYQACKANPGTAVACGVAGVGLLVVAAPGIVAAPSLAAAGFGANGVVLGVFPVLTFPNSASIILFKSNTSFLTGSTAASVQSGIGSVVAPGLFATLQSAGAGGYGVATVYGAVQVAGGTVASSVLGVLAWSKAKL